MTIGGITGANSGVQRGAGMNPQADSVSKSLQNQIAQAQKELRELSSDQNIPAEEKVKKKQEIQQEIANLNQQLRQHQMEQRREQQSAKKAAEETANAGNTKSGGTEPGGMKSGKANLAGKTDGLSQASMRSMLSADSSMKQAQVQGSVAARMKGRAGVLKAEIKQDGGNTQAKKAELAEIEQKALDAEMSQMNSLAKANQEMRKAAEAQQGNRTETGERKVGNKTGEAETDAGSKTDKPEMDAGSKANKPGAKSGSRADGSDIETGKTGAAGADSKLKPASRYETESGEISEDRENDVNGRTAVQRGVQNIVYVPIDIRL